MCHKDLSAGKKYEQYIHVYVQNTIKVTFFPENQNAKVEVTILVNCKYKLIFAQIKVILERDLVGFPHLTT